MIKLPDEITDPSDDVARRGILMMLYAMPGTGKTPFIAGPGTLIIDSDEGTASAAGSGAKVWKATTWKEMDAVYEWLRHNPDHPFKRVWWDGVSLGQDKLLEDIMIDLIKPTSEGGRGKTHRKAYLVDQGEFQENFMRIKQWVRHMCALPVSFGITAHPALSFDSATDEEKLWPWVQGRNMPQTVSANFDIIAYARREKDESGVSKFKLYVEESDEFYARDRFGALGRGLINPKIEDVEKRIYAKLGIARKAGPVPATAVARKAAPPKPGQRPVPKKKV
jgi:hypothetical protein